MSDMTMIYDPIQGQDQGQGHETFKVRNHFPFSRFIFSRPIYGGSVEGTDLNLIGPDFWYSV